MKVYIVAGNADQARQYGLRKYVYVRDVVTLMGVRNCLVVLCGTYWSHPEYSKIRVELSRLTNFSNVVVRMAPVKVILAGSLESAASIAKKLGFDNWYWVTEPGIIPRGADVTIGWDFNGCAALFRELDTLCITNPLFVNPGK